MNLDYPDVQTSWFCRKVIWVHKLLYGKLSNNRQGKANVSIMCDSYYTSTHVGTFCFSIRQKWCDDQF